MTQLTTTLNRIRARGPCEDGWKRLLAGLGKTEADDEPLPFATIVRINGLNFALWCAGAEPQHEREWLLFAVWCGRQGQHRLTDPRSLAPEAAAEAAAEDDAEDDAEDAEWDAARAADAAAWAAAQAAWDAAREAQAAEFLRIVGGE
jgi:hypothetical protein